MQSSIGSFSPTFQGASSPRAFQQASACPMLLSAAKQPTGFSRWSFSQEDFATGRQSWAKNTRGC